MTYKDSTPKCPLKEELVSSGVSPLRFYLSYREPQENAYYSGNLYPSIDYGRVLHLRTDQGFSAHWATIPMSHVHSRQCLGIVQGFVGTAVQSNFSLCLILTYLHPRSQVLITNKYLTWKTSSVSAFGYPDL